VESGRALLVALAEAPRTFNLILTDVAMPDVNGLEVLRYVRSQPALHALPVIMMSAHENAGTGAPAPAAAILGSHAAAAVVALAAADADEPVPHPVPQSLSASSAVRRTTCSSR
jgi:CheY-like chemotaxis protein